MSPKPQEVLTREAPDWMQALLYSAFVLVIVSMVAAYIAFMVVGHSVAANVGAGVLGLVVAAVYFSFARRWVRVLDRYARAAADRLGIAVIDIRATVFGRGPGWQTLMMTHALLLLALTVPLLASGIAVQTHEAAQFERRMAASPVASETFASDLAQRADEYARAATRGWIMVGLLLAAWSAFAAFTLTRPKSHVARLLRKAARSDAGRDELVEAAVVEAIARRCLPPAA